jgi:hypothetical protein
MQPFLAIHQIVLAVAKDLQGARIVAMPSSWTNGWMHNHKRSSCCFADAR